MSENMHVLMVLHHFSVLVESLGWTSPSMMGVASDEESVSTTMELALDSAVVDGVAVVTAVSSAVVSSAVAMSVVTASGVAVAVIKSLPIATDVGVMEESSSVGISACRGRRGDATEKAARPNTRPVKVDEAMA